MYVPGGPAPQIQPSPNTATATVTNLHLPHTRGELETDIPKEVHNNSAALRHWESRTFNTTMSPVFDIVHVFTQPVSGFLAETGTATGELQHATEHEQIRYFWFGVIRGFFESDSVMGDFTGRMKWGDVIMLTNQTDKTTNGLWVVLPSESTLVTNRVVRPFRRLGDNYGHDLTGIHFRAPGNVAIDVQPDRVSMRLSGVSDTAVVLPADMGGMPLQATNEAWTASPGHHPITRAGHTRLEWIPVSANTITQAATLVAMPSTNRMMTPFVFLDLRDQIDPEENGVWRYDFASGHKTGYREFTRAPIMFPNDDLVDRFSKYFSYNVRARDGSLHYGLVPKPGGDIQFGAGSLALMLEPPAVGASKNNPVTTLVPQPRSAEMYTHENVPGHQLDDGSWIFATSQGHDALFILRASGGGAQALAIGTARYFYRTAPIGTTITTIAEFEALPWASLHGESAAQTTKPYLFFNNPVMTEHPGSRPASFKNSGTMLCGREFEAESMAFTHTLFQQRIGSSDTALDELRLRGLSVELPGIFATHGISHSSSGVGREHGRTPHVNVHIEDGKKTTSTERHNIHYRALRIPHEISYKYVYTDTGEALADEHGDAIGKCVLTSQFRGFVV